MEKVATPGCSKGSSKEEQKEHLPRRRNSKDLPPDMSIVLVGKTGAGKSATGNNILGITHFRSTCRDSSVTKECEKKEGKVAQRHISVIDTPGLFDTELPSDEIEAELGKCVALSAPGPHAFLVVIEVGRFTEEERRAVETIQEKFGEGALKYSIVLFTHADKLEGDTIEKYIQAASQDLQLLVENCGNRYHAFNNRNMSDRTQVTELLEKIDRMVEENGGSCYTNEMYQKAEAAIRQRVEELKKQLEEDQLKKEKEQEAKHQKELEELIKKMKLKYEVEVKEKDELINELKTAHRLEMEKMKTFYEEQLRNLRKKAEKSIFGRAFLNLLRKQ